MGSLFQHTATTIAGLIIAFTYSWDLTLVIIATIPLMALLLAFVSARIQPNVLNQRKELANASEVAINAFSNVETVKRFNGQEAELDRYKALIQRAAHWYAKQTVNNSFQIGCIRVFTLAMFVQAFWYGHHLVVSGKKSTGDVVTTFWSALIATQAFEIIMPQLIVLEKGRSAGFALSALARSDHSSSEAGESSHGFQPRQCLGSIRFDDVTFTYPASQKQLALMSLTCHIEADKTTFIVGKSGLGKSSIGQLLMRFYPVDAGNIELDSHKLDEIDHAWLRRNITLVEQNRVLFSGTLTNNIEFGTSHVNKTSGEDVRLATEFSLLQQTINDLSEGMETKVGAKGASLSNGQRQRMALARARLRDSPILILDESTSALDHITRGLIMAAIRKWRSRKRTIIITHDISQIQEEDHVLVMENGRLVESGLKQCRYSGPGQPFHRLLPRDQGEGLSTSRRGSSAHLSAGDDSSGLNTSNAVDKRTEPDLVSSGFERLPTVFSHRMSMTNIPMNFFPIKSTYANQGIYTLTEQTPHLRTRRDPDDDRAYRCAGAQQQKKQFPHGAAELMDVAGYAAVDSRTGMINRRRSPKIAQNNDTKAPTGVAEKTCDNEASGLQAQHPSITAILLTAWPALDTRNRLRLVLGIASTITHAVASPMFSWVFARLISTLYAPDGGSGDTLTWSVAILGIAVADSISCYAFHYLIERCGQKWIDHMRFQAMQKNTRLASTILR